MKTNPYLLLDRMEFTVTHQCTGRCRHCSVGDRINQTAGGVDPEAARRAVEAVASAYPIGSLMTFGGEPLLYLETTCAIHAAARRRGIPRRQMITNGFFTKDGQRIGTAARELVKAGINDLLLSVDAFHQETIPLEPVRLFIQALLEAGMPKLRLHPAWVVEEGHDNPYNRRTREILEELAPLGAPVSSGNNIFPSGNAAVHLAEYYPMGAAPDLDVPCGSQPYTDPLDAVRSLSIGPDGEVVFCAFPVGNIHKKDILEILTDYNPFADEWTAPLARGGVRALLRAARERGVFVDTSDCRTACGVCRKIAAACAEKREAMA